MLPASTSARVGSHPLRTLATAALAVAACGTASMGSSPTAATSALSWAAMSTVTGNQVYADTYVVVDGNKAYSVMDIYIKGTQSTDIVASVYGVSAHVAAWTQNQSLPFRHAGNSSWNPNYTAATGAAWDSFLTTGMRVQTADADAATPIKLTADPGFSNFSSANASRITGPSSGNGPGWYPAAGATAATNPFCVIGNYNGSTASVNQVKSLVNVNGTNGFTPGQSLDNCFMIGRFAIDTNDMIGSGPFTMTVKFCMTALNTGSSSSSSGASNTNYRVNQTLTFVAGPCGATPCPDLQTAVDSSPAGSTLLVPEGTYKGGLDFKGKAITVRAQGRRDFTFLEGQTTGGANLDRAVVLAVSGEGPSSVLEGFTVRNGVAGSQDGIYRFGGGMFVKSASPTIRNCAFLNNRSGFGGGAYLLYSNSDVDGCLFSNNFAISDGGGLQLFGGSPVVRNCSITNNTAQDFGGGAHVVQHLSGGAASLINCTITGNQLTRDGTGGGVSLIPDPTVLAQLTLSGCSIQQNVAPGDNSRGGGVYIKLNAGLTPNASLINTTVCGNITGAITNLQNVFGRFTGSGNTICDCAADLDASGVVDSADIGTLLVAFGTATSATYRIDLDGDGMVTSADIAEILLKFGSCSGSPTLTDEPGLFSGADFAEALTDDRELSRR